MRQPKPRLRRVSFRLPVVSLARVTHLAREKNTTLSAVIREAIDAFIRMVGAYDSARVGSGSDVKARETGRTPRAPRVAPAAPRLR